MSRVRVLVIDGQGGGLGRQLTAALAAGCPDIELTAVGTNSIAASAMLKAGAHRAATGENAVVVNCRRADIIVGPIVEFESYTVHGLFSYRSGGLLAEFIGVCLRNIELKGNFGIGIALFSELDSLLVNGGIEFRPS